MANIPFLNNAYFAAKVGIGTDSPEVKLDVRGQLLVAGDTPVSRIGSTLEVYRNGTTAELSIHQDSSTVSSSLFSQLRFRNGGNDTYLKVPQNGNGFIIDVESQANAFVIGTTGNVGIGTTSPGAKLQVDGSVKVGSGAVTDNNSLTVYGNNGTASKYIKLTHHNASSSSIQTDNTYLSISASNYIVLGSNALIYQGVKFTNNKKLEYQESDNSYFTVLNVNSSNLVQLGSVTGVSSGGDTALYHNGAEKVRITSVGVGIGTTSPVYKLDVNGGARAGGVITYSKSAGSLDTTGYAVAGLTTGSNGNSTGFTFTCYGNTGGYQKIVYSCYNGAGTWYPKKVIDEGTNDFDVEASANGSTITFTFKSTSGTKNYTPRVTIEATGHSINSTYA